jgi:hypothetical protein
MKPQALALSKAVGLILIALTVASARSEELVLPKSSPPSASGLQVIPADTFAGRSDFAPPGNPGSKSASWGRNTAGSCAIEQPTITLNQNGTASFSALVASGSSNDSYCVTFDFFDRNQLNLFHWPRICSPTLGGGFQKWTRDDLAVPEQSYPFIVFATRADHC